MKQTTPCQGRDEWTRDTSKNRHTPKSRIDQDRDAMAGLQAQLTCYTRCPIRQQCFDLAMANGGEDGQDDWHIWGGHTQWERRRIRATGPLVAPSAIPSMDPTRRKKTEQRIREAVLHDGGLDALAEKWGMSASGVNGALRGYLWMLRVSHDDPWVVLHEVEDSPMSDSRKNDETVRAA